MSNVSFRRINGHIVPIKQGGSHKTATIAKDVAKGTGIAAAGVGTALASGSLSAELALRAQKLHAFATSAEVHANRAWSKDGGGAQALKHMAKSEKLIERSARASRFSTKAMNYGHVAGAALIGTGINKALSHTALKDHDEARQTISGIGGGAAVFAVKSVYAERFGSRGAKMTTVLKNVARLAARKVLRSI
jgi:hypothetical protein